MGLERLTVPLDAPELLVLDGDTDALSILEKLAVVLKGDVQKTIIMKAKVSGQEMEVVKTETVSKKGD